jgi:hypothetical protein
MSCNTPVPNPPQTGAASGFDTTGNCAQAQRNARQRALADAIKWAVGRIPQCPGNCKFRTVAVTFSFAKPPCKASPDDEKKLEAVCTWSATVACTAGEVGDPTGKTLSNASFMGLECTQYFEKHGTGSGADPVQKGAAEDAAVADAGAQAAAATLSLGIACLDSAKCPQSRITVSIGAPDAKIDPPPGTPLPAGTHSQWVATCAWRLVGECV